MDGVLGSETESHVIMDGTVNIFHGERDGVLAGSTAKPEKLIIDTDPGIDDTMAILMAFQSPELEVLGLTTIFGNVSTEDATRNALLLDSVRSQGVQMFLSLRAVQSLSRVESQLYLTLFMVLMDWGTHFFLLQKQRKLARVLPNFYWIKYLSILVKYLY